MSRLPLQALRTQTSLLRSRVSPLSPFTAFGPLWAASALSIRDQTKLSTFPGRSHSTKRPPQIHYSEEVLAATREIERLVQQNRRTHAAATEKNDPSTQKIATKSCHIAPCKASETNFQNLSRTVSTPHSTAKLPSLQAKTPPTTSPAATDPKQSDPTSETTTSNSKISTAEQKFTSIVTVVGISFLGGLPVAYVLGLPLDLFMYNMCQNLLIFILITLLR